MSLSLNALSGVTGGKTIKLIGTCRGRQVLILIDCGATHSFIQQELVDALDLPVDKGVMFTVQVGDARNVSGRGLCRDLPLLIQGLEVVHSLYPFHLGGSDVILGADWLEVLDEVLVSWKRSTLKIDIGGQWICLKGDPALHRTQLSSKALKRAVQGKEEAYLVELAELRMTELSYEELQQDVKGLLKEFPDVQEAKSTLPPSREVDHVIDLKPGVTPPNIRPYRYPFYQKGEIERLVREMLEAGIIRPSKSPFSSPVLLVKKKDGSWRFCVDYRALNNLTIQDKFPIPAIEELLRHRQYPVPSVLRKQPRSDATRQAGYEFQQHVPAHASLFHHGR